MSVSEQRISKKAAIAEILKRNGKEARRNWQLYLFLLPYMLMFFLFIVVPVIVAIILGFTSFNILTPPHFVGLQNYITMFLNDDVFMIAFKNTLMFAVIIGAGGFLLSLAFAWMINELPPKARAFMTLIFYAPTLTAMYSVFKMIFSSDPWGLLNAMIARWGFSPVAWLESGTAFPITAGVLLWASMGAGFLAFIASLQGVDRALYEAASVDGIKNRWQELWYVTLPYIRPHMLFASIMSITAAFGLSGQIELLVGFPSTNYVVHTIAAHMQDYASARLEMGYACALATFLFLLMVVSNKLAQKFLMKVGD